MQILNSIGNMFSQLSGNTAIGKFTIALSALITSYITPVFGLLVACSVCSIIDMIYGIKVSKEQHKKITSKRNWKGTLWKIRDEFTLILLAHLIEYTVLGDNVTFILSGAVAAIITLTELWSILENLNTLNPDGPWKSLSKFLKKKGEDYIGVEFDSNETENDSNNKKAIEE